MSMHLEASIAKHRHQDMLRDAEQRRLARRVAQANGTETLFRRMVNLLSRSNRPAEQSGRSEKSLNSAHLADATGR